MPPCVRISPSSTVSPPGPTCFQPVRSLPLKSCCHLFGSPLHTFSSSAANASAHILAHTKMQTINRFSMGNLRECLGSLPQDRPIYSHRPRESIAVGQSYGIRPVCPMIFPGKKKGAPARRLKRLRTELNREL